MVDEKANFVLVESYVTERRASASAWSAVFDAKNAGLLKSEWEEKLLPLAKAPSIARDQLAAAIHADISAFQVGLDFYQVDSKHLEKAAYAHLCRENVVHYQAEKDALKRSELANAIFSDPKAHHSAIMDANISWKQLHQDKRPLERRALFAEFSNDEKRLWRLAREYTDA